MFSREFTFLGQLQEKQLIGVLGHQEVKSTKAEPHLCP